MARAALNWSARDLAEQARVGSNTVVRFENGKPANTSTVTMIRQALEAAGLVFIDADETAGEGVRLKKPESE